MNKELVYIHKVEMLQKQVFKLEETVEYLETELAMYKRFITQQGFGSLEDLEKALNDTKKLFKMWNELKEFVKDDIDNNKSYYAQSGALVFLTEAEVEQYILEKIEDLEG